MAQHTLVDARILGSAVVLVADDAIGVYREREDPLAHFLGQMKSSPSGALAEGEKNIWVTIARR